MKNRFYVFSLTLLCLFGAFSSQAQNKLIKGKITDERGAAIAYASVSVKGSDIGTASNDSGAFEILVPSSIKSLNVSAVGFEARDVAINGDYLDITLFGLSADLDEVVVVGYGTQKVTKVSGAISTVKGAEIEKFKPVRTEDALQGRASGVTIISPGSPGAKPTVLIRGIPSYSGVDPVVIVDGNIQTLDDLNSISPADIESVNILKDAAGTAIYGVKGGNGVILITTKTGRKNQKTEFTYSGMYGIQEVPNIIGVLNASEYAAIVNEGSVASGGDLIFKDISNFGVGTNWQNEIFKQAPITQHALTARGGSEKMTYFLSGAFLDQAGIVGGADKSGFQRLTGTANLVFDMTKKLRLFVNTTYVNLKGRSISENAINGVISNALNFDPTVPIFNPNPDVYGRYSTSPNILSEIINPLTQLEDTYNTSNVNKMYGKVEIQYTIIKNLTFSSRFGYTYTNINGRSFTPLSFYGDGHINSTLFADGTARPGAHNNVNHNTTDFFNYVWENFASYNFKLNDVHNFDVVAGISQAKNSGKTMGGFVQDVPFNSWEFAYAQAATGTPQTGGRNFFANKFFERRNLSYFGRINYDYDGRYLASFTARRDGSNAFGSENRFANFYAGSLGWVVSNENFWRSDFIDLFKLRGSYGVTGNENVLPQFQRISNEIYLYNLGQNAGYTFGNEPTSIGSTISSYRNDALAWEKQNQFNFGFDMRFLKNKFNLSADYYRRDISGLLFNPTLSLYLGTAALPTANIGTTETQGVDITLGYTSNIGRNLKMNTYLTFTTAENKVTETNEGLITGGTYGIPGQSITRFEKGFPPGYFFGWKTNGIFQNEADVKNGPSQPGAQPGDIRFVDVNGDGIIDADDRTIIGNPFPKFTMGWGMNLEYKGFDFTTFWYGSFGNDVYRAYERNLAMTNKNRMVLGRWTGEGTTNDARFPRYSFVDDNLNARASDRYLEDGSFVKIKDLQFGYSFTSEALKKFRISKLRAFAQVRNAFTFTNYSGFDPEIAGGIFESGIDRGIFPQARTWSLGVDVRF
jgi:TonB-dependent starch-binding outer membrane protein SusC